MALDPHWRRLNRALDQIEALDRSIKTWLDSDAYRIVKEHDASTRRTAYVARIAQQPDDWPDLVGEAVHSMRSALDRLAFVLNAKGYADAHKGASIPPEREADSTFPIFGNVNQRGMPMDGEAAFKSGTGHRLMPAEAISLIESLQPYKRGQDFARDPLWAIHELGRIDRHRIDLALSASLPRTVFKEVRVERTDELVLGIGGPVYDGKELSYWVIPEGYPEPDPKIHFTRTVAFGQSTPLGDQPVIPTLRGIRNYLRFKVAFPLGKFL